MEVFTANEVREMLKSLVGYGVRQRDLATKAGVSNSFISDILKGNRNPSGGALDLVGIERRVIYVRKPTAEKGGE